MRNRHSSVTCMPHNPCSFLQQADARRQPEHLLLAAAFAGPQRA
jgi:hypothetical protein